MDGISFLQPLTPELQEFFYAKGNAHGWLNKNAKTAASYHLAGRLYLAKSGWLLLSVPNAFVRGLFDALVAPGAELPTTDLMNVPNADCGVLNAHISVMTADEVKAIGADKINERGHTFNYGLGPVEEVPVSNVDGVSKVWAVQIKSPGLSALRKSYGLPPYIHSNHPFHITVAARRKKVLGNNPISKFDSATGRGELKAAADDKTTYDCCCSGPCTCPPTCICKKSGYCGHKKEAEEMPWRERVEVYTRHPQTGKIYGGVWDTDKSFAVPGGGLDSGETPEQAAIRELEEETGIKATNPVRLPVPPVDNRWSDAHRAEKAKVGRGHFAGTRTHFVVADFLEKARNKKLDHWGATNRKFYSPAKALALMQDKQFMAPDVAAGRIAALQHILAGLKKTSADLLAGGEADNKPDSDFSADKLQEGAEHEREHTDNGQIAKEIAKDHLQEDPAYYEKQKELKHAAEIPSIILKLREAKAHSDAKRYDKKNAILRDLMLTAPNEWYVDDPIPHHMGVTHDPTKFRFHAHPTIIPPGVKVKAKAAAAEPYLAQLKVTPVNYNKNESVWRNFVNHLVKVKGRGDHQLHTQQNSAGLLRAMNPKLQQQYYMDVARGKNPGEPGLMTKIINRHGGSVLSAL